MLPFGEMWVKIKEIFEQSPLFSGNIRVYGFNEEVYQQLVKDSDDFKMSTLPMSQEIINMFSEIPGVDLTYRCKEASSIKIKLERLTLKKKLFKVANDILGFRFIFKTDTERLKKIVEEFVSCSSFRDHCNVVDQTDGKRIDDGYRGIHVNIYISKAYPIEIQFWTRTHALLNEYLHANIYKIDNMVLNQYAVDLSNWFKEVPLFPESGGLEVQSYIDFIYEKVFYSDDDETVNGQLDEECDF
ncbi:MULTISPECIES: RelA/SpoT domain-containing protein [Heyndrickxia]|uniref:RelA/SpoT domain-containing protein n=1 Tax=Heyndrickxia TaxID=2837504 RepID=UPI002DBF41B9|nr:RelA/SpoT domain-containing protein [Weizmannia sp. CD-2023]MEC2304043.1 RelA/SpoT domain-containing protein [Weizmannia sp. CD-2023]MEC2339445.1 RelA/SpoT domain-containing protein [Weizmannia sp. CD-2023]